MMRDLSQQASVQAEAAQTAPHFGARLEAWVTVERAGYAGVLLLALVLRMWGLGALSPSLEEAAHALQALAAARGLPYEMTGASPLLFHIQRVTLALFASSSAALRFWAALLGGASVLLFYSFRRRIGPGGALMAAFLWAISPLAVFTSRLAVGNALVAPLALGCAASLELLVQRSSAEVGAGSRAGTGSGRRYAILAGVSLALMLLAGQNAYTVLAAAGLAMLIWRPTARALWQAFRPYLGAGGLAFLLTLGLVATLGFTAPQGLAAAFELPGRWVQALIPWAGEYGAGELLGRLLMNEVLVLALGVVGFGFAMRRRDAFGLSAALFALVALLAAAIGQGRNPVDLVLVVLPLVFLAGPIAAGILAGFPGWSGDLDAWLLAVVNFVLIIAAAFSLPGAFSPANTPTWRNIYLAVGAVALVLAGLEWVAYAIWGNVQTVRRTLPFVLLVLGVFWTISQAVGVNLDRGAWRQAGVLHETTASGYRDLERSLGELASLHGKGARETPVDVVLTPDEEKALGPLIGWLLRDYPMVTWSAAAPQRPAPLVITAAQDQPALARSYSGAEFRLLEQWKPAMLPSAYARLRWVLFRESSALPDAKNVLLWVRNPETAAGSSSVGTPADAASQNPDAGGAVP